MLAENIKYYRKKKGLTQAQLALRIGITRSLVGAYEEGRAEPKLNTLLVLADFFEVTTDALLRNVVGATGENVRVKGEKLRVLPIVTTVDKELASIVPIKAAAGYLSGYGDVDFIGALPRFQMAFPELPQDRTYRAFQIKGDSMLPVPAGAYMLCSYLQDWNLVRNNNCYVVVLRSEGIVYKRLINNLVRGEFVLQSDNDLYASYEVNANDVLEIWRADAILNFKIPDKTNVTFTLQEEINQIKADLKAIKSAVI